MHLLSPVFGKEMITLARRKRHYFVRALMLGVLLLTIWLGWRSQMARLRYRGFQDLSDLGHQLFMIFAVTQMLTVLFLAPALTAPVIASEKDQNTLGLLLMSNLRGHNILLDKVLSRFALLFVLLLSGLPLFLALLAFRGITPGHILIAYMDIFSTMLFCGGLGLLCSTICDRMHVALIAVYVLLVAYVFGVIVLMIEGVLDEPYLLPVGTMAEGDLEYSLPFFILSLFVFSVSLQVARILLPTMAEQKKRRPLKSLFARMNEFFHRINFTGVNVMSDTRELGRHALLWKEAHKRFFNSRTFMLRACYALVMLSLVLMIFLDEWDVAVNTVVFGCMLLVAVIAVVSSSTSFAGEREAHSFEILMSSPVTARALVIAKFIGVLKLTVPVIVCIAIWLAIARVASGYLHRHYWDVDVDANVLLVLAVHIPLITVIGLCASASRRKTASALLLTFLCFLAWALLPFVIVLLHQIATFHWFKPLGLPLIVLLIMLPVLALCAILRVLRVSRGIRLALFATLLLWALVVSPTAPGMLASDMLSFSSATEDFIISLSPIGAVGMIVEKDLSLSACGVVTVCWVVLLMVLICRFDRVIGRQ